ncbi:carbon-phosphorus lyase complex subunit PhnI [Desulfolithobacter sp.]
MSYVAIKGGTEAITASKALYKKMLAGQFLETSGEQSQLLFGLDRIMSEGALYSQQMGSRAIEYSGCDLLEAAFYLRAHRSTCRRAGTAETVRTEDIRLVRRISSAFKEIPGGQLLGPSSDYLFKLLTEKEPAPAPSTIPGNTARDKVAGALDELRRQDKILKLEVDREEPFDITRATPLPPYPRSSLMQMMARGETGSMLAFAYTSLRGYGDVHPTIGELRLGMVALQTTHPFTNNRVTVGEIRVTAVESVGSFKKDPRDGKLRLATGFGFCFGFNETKAIAMSILDLAMTWPSFSIGENGVATSPEMIMHHIDGIESMGFTNHFKMPHYVTFQADLHTFNKAKDKKHHD